MHAVLHALPLALGTLIASVSPRSFAAELPPIFAPRPASSEAEPRLKPARGAATTPVSNRVRSLINAASGRVLNEAVPFDAPVPASEIVVDPTTGMAMMAPVVVRGAPLEESQVRPPRLELYRFVPVGGDKHRRIAGGAIAPLFQKFFGGKEMRIELSIFNAAGNGIDHNIDFTRAELGFRFMW
jgi:hypothetical protein